MADLQAGRAKYSIQSYILLTARIAGTAYVFLVNKAGAPPDTLCLDGNSCNNKCKGVEMVSMLGSSNSCNNKHKKCGKAVKDLLLSKTTQDVLVDKRGVMYHGSNCGVAEQVQSQLQSQKQQQQQFTN